MAAQATIICPHCKQEFPLTEALSHEYELKAEAKAEEKVRREMEIQLKDKTNEVEEQRKRAKEAEQELLEKNKKIREVEQKDQQRELEFQRKLVEDEKKITEEVKKRADEENRLKMAEYEKRLQDASTVNDELRRKLEQGSQQTQGEVQELILEEFLKAEFPNDQIAPVAKGVRGGDVLQTVFDKNGRECGKILWESKQTKAWSDGWVAKLKEDARAAGADVAVIISAVLPEKVKNLGYYSGIWVTNLGSALGASWILRYHLVQATNIRKAAEVTGEDKDELYKYVTGSQFAHRVEAMMDSYQFILEDIEKEKRWFSSKWARQEKSVRTLMEQTGAIHGELAGIVGSALPTVKSLELTDS
ncbi:DUF2130 domain-containing protein [Patescibacteria group bacterium]|nr:DUF2130 domain-containing protein [Patescibacteria group bacterium]